MFQFGVHWIITVTKHSETDKIESALHCARIPQTAQWKLKWLFVIALYEPFKNVPIIKGRGKIFTRLSCKI